jgi:hypothetical protein
MNKYIIDEAELSFLLNEIRKSQYSEITYERDGQIGGIVDLVEWVIKFNPYNAGLAKEQKKESRSKNSVLGASTLIGYNIY